jgi:hypothetical protein
MACQIFIDIKEEYYKGIHWHHSYLYIWVVDYILRKAEEETDIGYTMVKGGQKGRIVTRR